MSNEQQMYRQHKRMRVGTFLTSVISLTPPAQLDRCQLLQSLPLLQPTCAADPGDGRPLTSGCVVRDVQPQCPGTGATAGLTQCASILVR